MIVIGKRVKVTIVEDGDWARITIEDVERAPLFVERLIAGDLLLNMEPVGATDGLVTVEVRRPTPEQWHARKVIP